MKSTDFAVQATPGKPFTVLQITDMQVIDGAQRRYPERLSEGELKIYKTEYTDRNCYAHIRKTVDIAKPDLIVITGDIVYGSFDDSGRILEEFAAFMGTLGIPWAPVFGNHDNESQRGLDFQCATYAAAPNCLFRRGDVSGNSNYTVGIYEGETPVRVLYMMDSNACYGGEDPAICKIRGFAEDQVAWFDAAADAVRAACGRTVPGFLCCHIPTADVCDAFIAGGYHTAEDIGTKGTFTIGKEKPAADPGDFGAKDEVVKPEGCSQKFEDHLLRNGVDGEFAGHFHKVSTSVSYHGIRYTFGVKCGIYDYRTPEMIGGTKITVGEDRGTFAVEQIYQGEKAEDRYLAK